MAGPIAQYYANVGISIDNKDLRAVDQFLSKIESRLKRAGTQSGFAVNLRVDPVKFQKHLNGVMKNAAAATQLVLKNVTVSPSAVRASIDKALNGTANKGLSAKVNATLNRASIAGIRQQLEAALQGVGVGVRLTGVRTASGARSGGSGGGNGSNGSAQGAGSLGRPYGSVAASRRASLTGRGDPSMTEFLSGRPDKSSLSAGNRRYVDAMVARGTSLGGRTGVMPQMAQAGIGGLARAGSSGIVGRMAGMAGMVAGGPALGTAMMAITGAGTVAAQAVGTIWKGLAGVITTPISMIGGAISSVTGAFYNVALAAAPLIGAFALLSNKVIETQQRGIALNTISKSLGSDGVTEGKWLMDMANRDGLRYDTLVQPFTSFVASASPSLGLGMSKEIFESMTRFGVTRGADDESMKRAMVAVSQMAGKGKVGAEELRQQLGDAQGFGEMQSIFAEAYQYSLGKDENTAAKGQKALEELYDAMKDGNVYSAKILPFVKDIANRKADVGIEEARYSAGAERARFQNRMTEGWKEFTANGGSDGLALFWRMAQLAADWFKENGKMLGNYFELFMINLDIFRVRFIDFISFMSNGILNETTDLLVDKGMNVVGLRESFITLWDGVSSLFMAVAEALGFSKDGSLAKGLTDKLVTFTNNMVSVFNHLGILFQQVAIAVESVSKWMNLSMGQKALSLIPGTESNQILRTGQQSVLNALGAGYSATQAALGTTVDAYTGKGDPSLNKMQGQYAQPINNFGYTGAQMNPQSIMANKPEQIVTHRTEANVNLNVQGDAEAIKLLMDERARQNVQLELTKTLQSSLVNSPVYGR